MPLNALTPFFTFWRTSRSGDREITDAVVRPEHRGPSESLHRALADWPGVHYWAGERLSLIRALRPAPRERWVLHTALFFLTFLTVWVAGTFLTDPGARFPLAWSADPSEQWLRLQGWWAVAHGGLGFATALVGILLVHEMGHYVAARRYHINASPPYFIPAPHNIAFVGTFGAFIRLRSPVVDRRQLFDVGAAGPWAGLVVSIVVLAVGFARSDPVLASGPAPQMIHLPGLDFYIGDSLLMASMRHLFAPAGTIELHPLALAGWFGLFVTMLNLLPLGQLDGGHVLYALVGRHQAKVATLMWYALIPLGFGFRGWWLWAVVILLLGRGRIAHPPVLDNAWPVPRSRYVIGIATAVIFLLTFTPDPFPNLL